jgi:hypothetical protein
MAADQGQMQVGGKTAVQCQPGCAVLEHRHGASSNGSSGGGAASSVSEVQAELLQSVEDQRGGYNHYGKFGEWIEKIQGDLQRIMQGSGRSELGEILGLLSAANADLATSQQKLVAAADVTEQLAGQL